MIAEFLNKVVKITQATGPSSFTPFCQAEPGVISRWSPSTLDLLQECPRKFFYEKLARYTEKEFSVHLWFGTVYHEAITRYRRSTQLDKLPHEEAVLKTMEYCLEEWDKVRDVDPWPDNKKGVEQLCRAVLWYIDDAADSSFAPVHRPDGSLALELDFLIELPMENPDGEPYVLFGIVDELAQLKEPVTNRMPIIRDRKTTGAQLNDNYFQQFKPNNQTAAYGIAGHVALEGQPFSVMIEAMQTQVGGTRFQNLFVEYSKEELDEWIQDQMYWIKQAEVYAENNYWPMNRTACTHKGGCKFWETCGKAPSVRQTVLHSDFKKLPSVWEGAIFQRLLSHIIGGAT